MIEKDVTESCLQRRDDREGCNGRMPEKDVTVTKEGGGYSVPDVLVQKD